MFKTLFVAFFLLSLCVLPFGDTGHTSQLDSIKLDNIPSKFKVCVPMTESDSDVEKRLKSFVKRELRALGDVEIVSFIDDDWDFLLQHFVMELERKDGTKTGWLSIAASISKVVPTYHFKKYDYPASFKPVYPPRIGSAYWEADKLLEYAIQDAAKTDEYLAQFRLK